MPAEQLVASLRHHWWLFLLRGLAAIVFGALALLWPGATVVALTAFIAAYALVDGVVAIGSAVPAPGAFARWWVVPAPGGIRTAVGHFPFFHPAASPPFVGCSG